MNVKNLTQGYFLSPVYFSLYKNKNNHKTREKDIVGQARPYDTLHHCVHYNSGRGLLLDLESNVDRYSCVK